MYVAVVVDVVRCVALIAAMIEACVCVCVCVCACVERCPLQPVEGGATPPEWGNGAHIAGMCMRRHLYLCVDGALLIEIDLINLHDALSLFR